MACCQTPKIDLSLVLTPADDALTVSSEGILVLDGDVWVKIDPTSETELIYKFYGSSASPLIVMKIKANADASQAASWEYLGGQLTESKFQADLLPYLTGTGLKFVIDLASQSLLQASLTIGMTATYMGQTPCPTIAKTVVEQSPLLVQLGTQRDEGLLELSDALLRSTSSGVYEISILASNEGSPIIANSTSYFEAQFFLESDPDNPYAHIQVAWGTNIPSATLVAVPSPQDMNAGEYRDLLGTFGGPISGPPFPMRLFFTEDFYFGSFAKVGAFDKKDWAESNGYVDDFAEEITMKVRVHHEGQTSPYASIAFPSYTIPANLTNPGYLAVDSLTGNVLLTNTLSGVLRESTEANVAKTISESNGVPTLFGITNSPLEVSNGKEKVYGVNYTDGELYEKTATATGWNNFANTMTGLPTLVKELRRMNQIYNTYPALVSGSSATLVIMFRGSNGTWYHKTVATTGIVSGIAIDTASGDIYTIEVSASIVLRRYVVSTIAGAQGDEPDLTASLVASYAVGDTDGAGNGTGAIGVVNANGIDAHIELGPVTNSAPSFYLTDRNANKIKHLTLASGKTLADSDAFEITTIGGGAAAGTDGTMGTGVGFYGPYGIVRRTDGKYLISEFDGHRIRLWDEPGDNSVSTYLGTGQAGNNDSLVI